MSIETRRRPHEEHHKRSTQLQVLDALLRIEELLRKPEEPSEPLSLPERRPDLDTKPNGTKATKPTRGGVTRL